MKKYDHYELFDLVVECNSYDGSFDWLVCYHTDEMSDLLSGLEPEQIANMVYFGNYNPSYQYFRFDGYGNIESVSEYDYRCELLDNADEIVEHAKELGLI